MQDKYMYSGQNHLICPINGMDCHELKGLNKDNSIYVELNAEDRSQICCGNCDECKRLETVSDEIYTVKRMDTTKNHCVYAIERYVSLFVLCAMTAPLLCLFLGQDWRMGILISFFFPLLCDVIGLRPTTFKQWCQRKYADAMADQVKNENLNE